MDKPEIPNLKTMTQRNCESLLNLYKTFSNKEIVQKEKFYILKMDQLRKNNMSKEVIWLNEDKLDLLIYEEERRTYIEICENIDNNDDNNLDQFDTEFWFNDEDQKMSFPRLESEHQAVKQEISEINNSIKQLVL